MNETPLQRRLSDIFLDASDRWNHQQDVQRFLDKIGGRVLCGRQAKKALEDEDESLVSFPVVDEYPFVPFPDTLLIGNEEEDRSPAAIRLPREIAERIAILGGLP
jgi:hypothetical protein